MLLLCPKDSGGFSEARKHSQEPNMDENKPLLRGQPPGREHLPMGCSGSQGSRMCLQRRVGVLCLITRALEKSLREDVAFITTELKGESFQMTLVCKREA